MENKQKFTSGPWIISSDGKAVRSSADIMANYRRNVVSVGKRDSVEEMAANLALCAAAPDLLFALKNTAAMLESEAVIMEHGGEWQGEMLAAVELARAALKKAEGQP